MGKKHSQWPARDGIGLLSNLQGCSLWPAVPVDDISGRGWGAAGQSAGTCSPPPPTTTAQWPSLMAAPPQLMLSSNGQELCPSPLVSLAQKALAFSSWPEVHSLNLTGRSEWQGEMFLFYFCIQVLYYKSLNVSTGEKREIQKAF